MAVTVSRKSKCGFCNDGNHDKCSIGVKHQGRHSKYPNGIVWACNCWHNNDRLKCARCGNRVTEEISPETWECLDVEACKATTTTRRANDPFLAQLREIKEKVTMAKIQENENKAEKEQKAKEPTFCLVTGEPTKGGLFKPGMDARYVSERVIEVENAGFTEKSKKAARSKMKNDGVSERLQAKFEKSVGLAEGRATAKAEAKAAKDQEKADKQAAKQAEAATA